ncbi:hypothetical protein Trydic_g17804 [Trypoxylus dichotomus]
MNLIGKVALITGGASGIGAACVEEFLKNSVRGVVIADIADGEQVAKDLGDKYGCDRVIYVKTDVSQKESFENAFKETIKKYNNVDVLINCAGIFNEIEWERMLRINLVGPTYGCLLAINEYFPKYKSSNEAYIINMSSIAGIVPLSACPHYASTKHGIVGLTRSLGLNKEINSQGIHIMGLCPGATTTPIMDQKCNVIYANVMAEEFSLFIPQTPQVVAESIIKLLQRKEYGSIWVINDSTLSKGDLPLFPNMAKILTEA